VYIYAKGLQAQRILTKFKKELTPSLQAKRVSTEPMLISMRLTSIGSKTFGRFTLAFVLLPLPLPALSNGGALAFASDRSYGCRAKKKNRKIINFICQQKENCL